MEVGYDIYHGSDIRIEAVDLQKSCDLRIIKNRIEKSIEIINFTNKQKQTKTVPTSTK